MKNKTKMLVCSAAAAIGLIAAAPLSASAALNFTDKPAASSWYKDENGCIFYYDSKKAAVTGEQIINGKPYLFSEDGTLKTGWRTVSGLRRYYSPETGEQVSGWIDYADGKYFYSADGGKKTGSMKNDDGNMIFFDEYGRLVEEEGFVHNEDMAGYVDANGHLSVGETVINDLPYKISSNGEIATGWQTVGGKKYYYDPETGICSTGCLLYTSPSPRDS